MYLFRTSDKLPAQSFITKSATRTASTQPPIVAAAPNIKAKANPMFNPAASAPTFSFSGAVTQAIADAHANSITNVQFNTVPHAAATTISTDITASKVRLVLV